MSSSDSDSPRALKRKKAALAKKAAARRVRGDDDEDLGEGASRGPNMTKTLQNYQNKVFPFSRFFSALLLTGRCGIVI
jgi:hypothetical protein